MIRGLEPLVTDTAESQANVESGYRRVSDQGSRNRTVLRLAVDCDRPRLTRCACRRLDLGEAAAD